MFAAGGYPPFLEGPRLLAEARNVAPNGRNDTAF